MDALAFSNFLNSITNDSLRVIDSSIDLKDYISIDLSSTNKDLAQLDIANSKLGKSI